MGPFEPMHLLVSRTLCAGFLFHGGTCSIVLHDLELGMLEWEVLGGAVWCCGAQGLLLYMLQLYFHYLISTFSEPCYNFTPKSHTNPKKSHYHSKKSKKSQKEKKVKKKKKFF